MTNKLLTLLFLLVFVALASCQQTVWKKFDSPEGAFSVMVPDVPTELTRTAHTPSAGDVDAHLCLVEQEDFVYGVTYADYPEDYIQQISLDNFFEMAIDGAAANTQGTVLSLFSAP